MPNFLQNKVKTKKTKGCSQFFAKFKDQKRSSRFFCPVLSTGRLLDTKGIGGMLPNSWWGCIFILPGFAPMCRGRCGIEYGVSLGRCASCIEVSVDRLLWEKGWRMSWVVRPCGKRHRPSRRNGC